MNLEIQSFIIGVVSGFSLSVLMFMFSKKSNLTQEKKVASVIFLAWIIMTFASFYSGRATPTLFDVAGFASASNLIGLSAFELMSGKVLKILQKK
tara:strand:- start:443 stop:727 length:285 start_codon:yes stop_codon:yes gene_type:complete